MLNLIESLIEYYPELAPKIRKHEAILKLLSKFLHVEEINHFINKNQHLKGFLFLDAILKEFEFDYKVSSRDLTKIPADGKVLIIANHPIGSLDGLALMRMVYDVRPDVKIIGTPLLSAIEPIKELILPIDNISRQASHKKNLQNIHQALQDNHAVIIFPAGEVSRITPKGIKDGNWKKGFLKIAKKNQAQILPVLIESRNSMLFYTASMLYKPLSTLLLIHEMYKQRKHTLEFIIGNSIEPNAWQNNELNNKKLTKKFRKHLFGLNKNKTQFRTTATIAHPIKTKRLHEEIKKLTPIGTTKDGMRIFLLNYQPNSLLMQEIGRLRELSFRMVNEGTGLQLDLDQYDVNYKHLLLWNDKELEVVGAYRMGFCGEIMRQHGVAGLYCSSLYDFDETLSERAAHSMELGRSFVQPKYWGLRGLEYLWYGIGAVLNQHPEIKYLFGAVSVPGNYPPDVLQQLVAHYTYFFPPPSSAPQAVAKTPYTINTTKSKQDVKNATKNLLLSLKHAGVKLPMLFKQYTDLCRDGGVGFINFATDPKFSGCVDGLIWLEVEQMKAAKKRKYIEHHQFSKTG